MGAGSSITSGKPQFRTGNIRTPGVAHATDRKSVTLRSGRDFVPGAEPLSTLLSRGKYGQPFKRDSLASERANTTPTAVEVTIMSHGERESTDLAANVFRLSNGGFVRTLDMDDDRDVQAQAMERLAASTLPVDEAPTTGRKVRQRDSDEKAARKAARKAQDVAVRALLDGMGHSGPITRQQRQAALDLIEHARQVQEMGR